MQFKALQHWFENSQTPFIIAGPCGAESPLQLRETAAGINTLGAVSLFRAGVWKPRTRPDSFEGFGEEALKWLSGIRDEFGLKITVEVANARHTELALKHDIDVLWIGARTTVNPFAVQEIAASLKGTDIPVLVKNPVHPDLQLWIGAIERLSRIGINRIAAVHRGFHDSTSGRYRNKPLWQIPIELKTLFPELPVICDPSHISGKSELVQQVAQEALDLGMSGLMIECHHNPAAALSDAQQQVTPFKLGEILRNLVTRHESSADAVFLDKLAGLRKSVDEVDEDILDLLKKRAQLVEKIGEYKKEHNITIFQLERWQEILRTRSKWAEKLGLSRQYVERICQILHEESIRIQNKLMNRKEIDRES